MRLKKLFAILFIGAALMFSGVDANAQCALCRRAAEGNMADKGESAGKGGLNKGILYLMSIPYLLVGIGLLAWHSEKRKKQNPIS